MATVTMIHHDGHQSFNVVRVKTKSVMGTFDTDMCLEVFNSLEGEQCPSLDDLVGNDPVMVDNVITCMGEESGYTFVYSDH